jgi:hypothetical protein
VVALIKGGDITVVEEEEDFLPKDMKANLSSR